MIYHTLRCGLYQRWSSAIGNRCFGTNGLWAPMSVFLMSEAKLVLHHFCMICLSTMKTECYSKNSCNTVIVMICTVIYLWLDFEHNICRFKLIQKWKVNCGLNLSYRGRKMFTPTAAKIAKHLLDFQSISNANSLYPYSQWLNLLPFSAINYT